MRSKRTARPAGAQSASSLGPEPDAATGASTSAALECPHFPPCAGCPLIPVPYSEQLAAKRRELIEALRPILRSEALVHDTVPSPRLHGYRNQARLVFRQMSRGGKSHVGLGLYLPGTHRVVHIPTCPIQPARLNDIGQTATRLAEQLGLSVYDERNSSGALRYLAMRCDRPRRHILVTIIVAEDAGRPLREMAERLRARHPEIVGVQLHVNARRSNVLFAGEDAWTLGATRLEDDLSRFRVFVSPRSFLQVNHSQAEWIYARLEDRLTARDGSDAEAAEGVAEAGGPLAASPVEVEEPATTAVEPDRREIVLDLYCGIGGIALHLAQPGRLVIAVEESAEAVVDAQRAVHTNGVGGVRVITARVEDFLRDPTGYGVDLAGRRVRAAVLNPPRVGCRPGVMEALVALAPERVAYVSCRPASMARDLERLGAGYALEEATPVDMIPLTTHVEALCILRRS